MLKLLIVEDEQIERIVLKKIITENFPEMEIVAEVENGNEAIAIIDSEHLDLVFLDINIPGVNGLDVCEYLKSKHPDTKVVITTAYSKFEFAFRAIKIKVNDYLLKPIRPEKIIDCINELLLGEKHVNNPQHDVEPLERLGIAMQSRSYKRASDCLGEIVTDTYRMHSDLGTISRIIVDIGEKIAETSMLMGIDVESRHQYQLSCLKERFAPYNSEYDVYKKLKAILDTTFDELIKSDKNYNGDINVILNFIERNINKNITLNDVATHANISSFYLSKIFKREMGINFITYLSDRRMELAKEMLTKTEKPIMNIAIDLSYNEPNYFSRVFKKHTGKTPSEYRSEPTT